MTNDLVGQPTKICFKKKGDELTYPCFCCSFGHFCFLTKRKIRICICFMDFQGSSNVFRPKFTPSSGAG